MEQARRAVGRTSVHDAGSAVQPDSIGSGWLTIPPAPAALDGADALSVGPAARSVVLNEAHLESRRIISYDVADQRSKSFDMLRTQILQAMDHKKWQLLAVTSPVAGCGKTLTAVNLALAIARQPGRSVLLVDMDLQKPQVARRLGIRCNTGLLGVLSGQSTVSEAMVTAHIGHHQLMVLPAEGATTDSSDWMASQAMQSVIQEIRRDFRSTTVILDMPPILLSDDVIAVLPQVDCALLVTAVGKTTVADVEECNKYLRSTSVVRVVVNKVPASNNRYY